MIYVVTINGERPRAYSNKEEAQKVVHQFRTEKGTTAAAHMYCLGIYDLDIERYLYETWANNIPWEIEYENLDIEVERYVNYGEGTVHEIATVDHGTYEIPDGKEIELLEKFLNKSFKDITPEDLESIDLKKFEDFSYNYFYDDAYDYISAKNHKKDSLDWQEVEEEYDFYQEEKDARLERGDY